MAIEIPYKHGTKLGDTAMVTVPKPFNPSSEEKMDDELREMLIHMSGGSMPERYLDDVRHVVMNCIPSSLEEAKKCNYYMVLPDGVILGNR